MNRKILILLAALALAMFGLAACGDDDDEGDNGTTTAETTETTTEETTDQAGGKGGTLSIEADPGGDLSYTTGALEVDAGEVTIEFDNPSDVPHDVRIEDADGNDVGGTEVISFETATATVDLEPGDYVYYCSVPGHREAGMEEDLTVK